MPTANDADAMTGHSAVTPSFSSCVRETGFRFGVLPVALLHLGLSIWSLADPVRVGIGDRAVGRLERAQSLAASSDRIGFALEQGWPGDYGLHALFLGLGGLPLLLLSQLALFMGTLVLLYVAVRRLAVPPWAAGVAVTAYALLASNLHQPHTVVTEAIFSPAVAVIVFGLAESLRAQSLSARRAIMLGAASAVAIALRAVFLPVLPVLSVFLWATRSARLGPLLLANFIALIPLLTWSAVQAAHDQPVKLGGEGFSLEHNLAGRMRRMNAMGGDAVPERLAQEAGVGDYLAYSVANPAPFVRASVTDGVMLIVNPGVNLVYGVFLGLFDRSEDTAYWVPLMDEHGPVVVGMELLRREPARLFWNTFGVVTWATFCLVSLVGVVRMARGPDRSLALALCLLLAVLSAATFASHAVRWSQRSPMEFALAIFFAVGLGPAAARVTAVARRFGASAPGGASSR